MKADKRSNWYETHRTCPSIISNAQKCAWNYANQMLYWFVVSCECSTTALCLCMRVFVNFTISIDWPFIKSTHTKTENRRLNYVNYIKCWIFQTKIKMFKVPKVMFSFPNAQKKWNKSLWIVVTWLSTLISSKLVDSPQSETNKNTNHTEKTERARKIWILVQKLNFYLSFE